MSDLFVPVSDIHIGDRIRKSIKSHDITRGHFAEILGVSNSKVDRILQNQTIETFLLYDISKKLGINFFSCYCRDWNPEDNSGETLYYYHIGKAIELYMKSINLSQSVLQGLLHPLPAEQSFHQRQLRLGVRSPCTKSPTWHRRLLPR